MIFDYVATAAADRAFWLFLNVVNCIVIDDEPLALELISSFVAQTPFLRLKGCYGNAPEAYAALGELDVQLIFLDIQMPDINGMQFARILRSTPFCPYIIFTTAHPHFAVEAYKVNAIDYLLKPIDYEDFLRAAGKVRAEEPVRGGYLFLKVGQQLVRIAHEDVLYVEAFRDYIKVYTTVHDKPLMALTTLKSVEEKLPAGQFMRIHKSFIVSLARIGAISGSAVHIGNAVITIGDQYRNALRQFIGKWTV